jgi:protein required for attachment to host cells
MSDFIIPHDAWVFVGDGRKALFLRNRGDAFHPDLAVESVFVDDNPPTREQGTDKPGRAFSSVGNVRSAVEQTDWHQIEEHRFAKKVAQKLESLVRQRQVKKLFVVAPARTLADLREAFHKDVRQAIVAEVDKDLTRHPVPEILRLLTAK